MEQAELEKMTTTDGRLAIDAAAERYLKSRDRAELELIQKIVDHFKRIYIMRIDQKDGIPFHFTFTPGELLPLDFADLPEEAKELNIAKAM
jgi:hypothetical protein